MVWRRTTIKRSSQDSDDVTVSVTPEDGVSRWQDESLRIVPQELWDRVKARQRHQSETLGAPIRAKLKAIAAEERKRPLSAVLTSQARDLAR